MQLIHDCILFKEYKPCLFVQAYFQIYNISKRKQMDLFKQKLDAQSSGIFDSEEGKSEETKVTTEIFDSTLPSELEFNENGSPVGSQNSKSSNDANIVDINFDCKDAVNEQQNKEQKIKETHQSQYQILTKSIMNFTFKKANQSLILRKTEHEIGSYIPLTMKIQTFLVKFYDEQSELSKGIPTYKLLWKKVVGYVKTELYIRNGYVYLLQKKKEGFLVHSIWDLQNLFKIFSDRQQNKIRMVFRIIQNNQPKLVSKEIVTEDLNFIAHIFDEAKNLQIVNQS